MDTEIYQIIALLVVAGGCFGLYYLLGLPAKKKAARLKEEYDAALRSGNKRAALEAGRAYYSALRSGELTVYDEQAITNDLNTM